MNVSKITQNYANSLLQESISKENIETIGKDAEFVLQIVSSNMDLTNLCKNPVIKNEKKLTIFNEIFSSKVSSEFLMFLKLVIQKNRLDLISNILTRFLMLKDSYEGIARVDLTIPFEPEERLIEEIRNSIGNIDKVESLKGKKIIFNVKIDKSILGGFRAKFKDVVIDGTLNNQISKIKNEFLKSKVTLN